MATDGADPKEERLQWLRSFTGGRWHALRWVDGFDGWKLVTYCAIPVPEVEHEQVTDVLPVGARGCIDCHNRLGCTQLHEIGMCTGVCGCDCWKSMIDPRKR